ncbi:head-tail joining protein [Ancylobacter polymorphus]|uniref:head-tail joining protein n=1 Tax=Ancylobacter polymorphus TaxID=223390 RepID=UPI003F999A2F
MIDAFASAIDALFADPNIGEDALWKAGGVSGGAAVRVIRKSPDRVAEFGDSRAVLPTVGIDISRSQAATIAEGDLILIGAETYRIIGEPMGDALGLVSACEAVQV